MAMPGRMVYGQPPVDPDKGRLVDLRGRQDDHTILRNPHKGWYWHYIDSGFDRANYREGYETVTRDECGRLSLRIDDDLADFPGLHHLYLRFNWGDVEPEEGCLDWSYIDAIMEAWGQKGYRFALRVCTFMGNRTYATPRWVLEAGARCREVPIDGQMTREPVYDDPVYLDKLARFMQRYGEKFNGHPLVDYVDVGTFGVWGEGNASRLYPTAVIRRHVDLHADNFPDTPVMFNDDFIPNRAGRELEPGESEALLAYVIERGLCLRDDSIAYAPYVRTGGYDGLLAPTLYDALYANGPIDAEFCHLSYYSDPQNSEGIEPSLFQDGYRALAALQRGRVTYAGFHGYPRAFLARYASLAYYAANRLGYWYFLEAVQVPALVSGRTADIGVWLSNRGFARCAVRYAVRWRLVGEGGVYTVESPSVDNRRWEPVSVPAWEQCTCQTIPLDLANVPPGEYALQLGLFEGERAIELGMQQAYAYEGFYWLATVAVRPEGQEGIG